MSGAPETTPDAAGLPSLGVIMPCLDEAAHIRESVASVLAFDYPRDRMTLTVVDGMSTDGTRDILAALAAEDPRIRLLDNPARLHAPALNLALESLDCEVVLRVDAHSVYPADYARLSVSALLSTGAENVGGVWITVPGARTAEAEAIAFALSHPFGVGNAAYRTGTGERRWTDTVPFGCWRMSTLRRLGGFSTAVPFGEDDELNGRIRAEGGRILLDPAIRSHYVARRDLGALARMMVRYGRSKPHSAARLGGPSSWRQLAPPLFAAGVLGPLALAPAAPALALAPAALIAAHLAAGAVVAARSRGLGRQAALRLPHTFLAAHLAYGAGYLAGAAEVGLGALRRSLPGSARHRKLGAWGGDS